MFNRILPYAMLYGAIRKTIHVNVFQLKSTNYDYYKSDKTQKTQPLYLTTKICIVAFSGASCGYLWPVYVCKDIYDMETYLRGDTKYVLDDIRELLVQ